MSTTDELRILTQYCKGAKHLPVRRRELKDCARILRILYNLPTESAIPNRGSASVFRLSPNRASNALTILVMSMLIEPIDFRLSELGRSVADRLFASGDEQLDHVWQFVKMHHDWRQSVCVRCGTMMVNKPNGETQFKAKGKAAWNPFASLSSTPPKCFAHTKSLFAAEEKRAAEERELPFTVAEQSLLNARNSLLKPYRPHLAELSYYRWITTLTAAQLHLIGWALPELTAVDDRAQSQLLELASRLNRHDPSPSTMDAQSKWLMRESNNDPDRLAAFIVTTLSEIANRDDKIAVAEIGNHFQIFWHSTVLTAATLVGDERLKIRMTDALRERE